MALWNKNGEKSFNANVQQLIEEIKTITYQARDVKSNGLNAFLQIDKMNEKIEILDNYLVSSPAALDYKTQALLLSMKDENRQPLDIAKSLAGSFFTADNQFGKKTIEYLTAIEGKLDSKDLTEKDVLSAKNNLAFVANVVQVYVTENDTKMDSSHLSFLRKLEGQMRGLNDRLSEQFPEQKSNLTQDVFNTTMDKFGDVQLFISKTAIQKVVINQQEIEHLIKSSTVNKLGIEASLAEMKEVKGLLSSTITSFENVFQFDKGLIARMDKDLLSGIVSTMNQQAGIVAAQYPQEEYVNQFIQKKIDKFANSFGLTIAPPVAEVQTQVMSIEDFQILQKQAIEAFNQEKDRKKVLGEILSMPVSEKPNDFQPTQIMAAPIGVIKGDIPTPNLLKIDGIEGLTVIEDLPKVNFHKALPQTHVIDSKPMSDPQFVFATLDNLIALQDLEMIPKDRIKVKERNPIFSRENESVLANVATNAVQYQGGVDFEPTSSFGKMSIIPTEKMDITKPLTSIKLENENSEFQITSMPSTLRHLIIKSHGLKLKNKDISSQEDKPELTQTEIQLNGFEGAMARIQKTRAKFEADNLNAKIKGLVI